MPGFGIGGGMLDEQADITQRRQDFTAKMAQLIAQNPDLDVQGLLKLVDNAAGTDNTLRGVYTSQSLTPYVQGRDRAKRVQVYNTLQEWLKSNPGATMADAQNAYYQYTGGVGGDPSLLSGFLDQAKQRKAAYDKQEQERQLSLMLQNRGAVESAANDILMQTGDIEKAKQLFVQQFGVDNPYGISADSLFNQKRLDDLSTRKAIEILSTIERMAGPDGDIRAYKSMFAKDLTGATGQAFDQLVEQRTQQKVQGYNTKISDSGAMGERAKMAAIAGSDPEQAFSGFVFQQIGMSPEQAAAQGIDLKTAKQNFDQTYKFWQGEKSKQDESEQLAKISKLEEFWKGDYQSPIAMDKIKQGKTAELENDILQMAIQQKITGFTALDAKRIVADLTARAEVVTRQSFEQKDASLTGDAQKFKDDAIKDSKTAAKAWWGDRSKGVAEANGVKDPTFVGLLEGVAGEFDFNNPTVASAANTIFMQWAQAGGTPDQLLQSLRTELKKLPNASIESLTSDRRNAMEIQSGRFNQSKPISVQDFQNTFTSKVQENATKIKGVIDGARGKDFNDPAELQKTIDMLTAVKVLASKYANDAASELAARQKYTDWLRIGEAVPPALYNDLGKQVMDAYSPLASAADEILTTLKQKKAQMGAVQEKVQAQVGSTTLNTSKLPPEIQSGYVPKEKIFPNESDYPVLNSIQNGINFVGDLVGEDIPQYRQIRDIRNTWLDKAQPGPLTKMTQADLLIAKNVESLLRDSRVSTYLDRNPAAMALLDQNSPAYNPQRFVEVMSNAIAGTTQTGQ